MAKKERESVDSDEIALKKRPIFICIVTEHDLHISLSLSLTEYIHLSTVLRSF